MMDNGENTNGVYTIKPDDGEPFEVSILEYIYKNIILLELATIEI